MSSPSNLNLNQFDFNNVLCMNMSMNMKLVSTPGSNDTSAVTTMFEPNLKFGLSNSNLKNLDNMINVSNVNSRIDQTGYFFPTTQFTDSSTSKAPHSETTEIPPSVVSAPTSSTALDHSKLNRTDCRTKRTSIASSTDITSSEAKTAGLKCKSLINSAKTCITGKKRKRGGCGDFEDLLSERKTDDNPGSVTFKTEKGTLNIRIPPPREEITKYELDGDCCTEEIEEILQPKKRTRYVRGLTKEEQKERRRQQNRNAAARSRARKNAMIAKVIQLHQENLSLRNYIAVKFICFTCLLVFGFE